MTSSEKWKELKDELYFLKSTYCQPGECEIVSPPSLNYDNLEEAATCYPVVLRLQLSTGPVVLITITSDYPGRPPGVNIPTVSSSLVSLAGLQDELESLASSLTPTPSLFQLADHVLHYFPHFPLSNGTSSSTSHPSMASVVNDSQNSVTVESSGPQIPCEQLPSHCRTSNSSGQALRQGSSEHKALGQGSSEHKALRQGSSEYTVSDSHTQCPNDVCVLSLDHMHSEQRYMRTLTRWSSDLGVGGWVLVGGAHSILVVLVGSGEGVGEMVKRWRGECVDVDRRGRPCRERMLKLLCQRKIPQHHSQR